MSVLIKMEIPNQCAGCKLWTLNHFKDTLQDICRVLERPVYPYSRDENCPLIPLPPHGDLIDCDFCMENYELLHDDDGNPVYAVRMRDIINAPTIIPAEKGEG